MNKISLKNLNLKEIEQLSKEQLRDIPGKHSSNSIVLLHRISDQKSKRDLY